MPTEQEVSTWPERLEKGGMELESGKEPLVVPGKTARW